jgi:antitoxin HicB
MTRTKTVEITPEVEQLANRSYRVIVSVDSEDGFIGQIAEMPGLLAVGDTADEMFELIQDAKRAWIATALAHNRPIPAPRVADAPTSKSGKFMVRLAPPIHAALAREAEIHDISLNELVSTVLSLVVGAGFENLVSAVNRQEPTRDGKSATPEQRLATAIMLLASVPPDATAGEDYLIGAAKWGT